MAILSKIRQRSFFLIVIIGLALFSFVLSGLFEGGTFGSSSKYAGSVNGEDIMIQDFQYKVGMAEQQGMSNVQASNNVWEQEVKRILLTEQFENLGLRVGAQQLINVMKENPNFSNNPQFLNEAGKFDDSKFQEYVKTMVGGQNPVMKSQWLAFESDSERSYTEQMYYTLIKSGIQATQAEGKLIYEEQNDKVDFDYVSVSYATINDDEAKVSDDEIIAYMKENKKKFKSDKTADMEFVFIENVPSKTDEDAMKTAMQDLLTGKTEYNAETGKNDTIPSFKNAINNKEFVNKYSDIKFDSTYVTKKDLPLEYQEQLFNLSTGEVFGPYIDNDYQKVSKKIDTDFGASVKASHILIAYEGAQRADPSIKRTKEEAKAKANELLAKAKANPASFAILATENTDDPGSKQNGGEYDNIAPNQMVAPFNDFIFDNPVGSIGVVETDFGFHVIKVSDKYNGVLFATVARKIEPSEETGDQNYTKAAKFQADANAKDFTQVAKDMGLVVNLAPNIKTSDENLPIVGAQRAVVLWAFSKNTDINDVKRFDVPTGFIVVKLKSINDSGLLSVEAAKPQVEPILKNKKKAEIIRKKMTGKTLEEVSKATNASILTAPGVVMNNALVPNIGPEPKVVGKAFAQKVGETSGLIDGTSGVYMVKTKAFEKAPAISNFATYVNQAKTQTQSSATGKVIAALKEKSEIEDLRIK